MLGLLFVFCRALNWRLQTRLSAERRVCWAGAGKRSITERRFFGSSTKSARRRTTPDGHFVLLTDLAEGQEAMVLQLPARPTTASEAESQKRAVYAG
jgi:hypothetical protein